MTAPDPHLIARRLSEPQKRALLWLDPDVERARSARGRIVSSLYVLWERGLAAGISRGAWWAITPLGIQVRAALARLAEEKSHGDMERAADE